MRKIKKFEPLSVMRISAICYGAIGLLEGAIVSFVFLLSTATHTANPGMPRWASLAFGGFAILFFPVLLGVIGAIMGGLGAVIYNVSARYVGGIAVEVE